MNGAQLAIDRLNESGGVRGFRIDFQAERFEQDNIASIQRSMETLGQSQVDAITFGTVCDASTSMNIVKQANTIDTPFFHSFVNEETVQVSRSSFGKGSVFQACGSEYLFGLRFLEIVREYSAHVATKPRVIFLDDNFTLGEANKMHIRNASEYGVEAQSETVDGSEKAWRKRAQQVKFEQPFAVHLGTAQVPHLLAFLNEFFTAPSRTLLFATWVPGTVDFAEHVHKFEGLIWSEPNGRYQDVFSSSFEAAYRKKFGPQPIGTGASMQFDIVNVISRAWMGSADPRNPSRVLQSLNDVVHRGLNGSYYYGTGLRRPLQLGLDTNDPSIAQTTMTYQIQGGRNVILSPKFAGDTAMRWPKWMSASLRPCG